MLKGHITTHGNRWMNHVKRLKRRNHCSRCTSFHTVLLTHAAHTDTTHKAAALLWLISVSDVRDLLLLLMMTSVKSSTLLFPPFYSVVFSSMTSLQREEFFELVATTQARRLDDQRAQLGRLSPPKGRFRSFRGSIKQLSLVKKPAPVTVPKEDLYDMILTTQVGKLTSIVNFLPQDILFIFNYCSFTHRLRVGWRTSAVELLVPWMMRTFSPCSWGSKVDAWTSRGRHFHACFKPEGCMANVEAIPVLKPHKFLSKVTRVRISDICWWHPNCNKQDFSFYSLSFLFVSFCFKISWAELPAGVFSRAAMESWWYETLITRLPKQNNFKALMVPDNKTLLILFTGPRKSGFSWRYNLLKNVIVKPVEIIAKPLIFTLHSF